MCCSGASTDRPKDWNHSQTYCHVVPVNPGSTGAVSTGFFYMLKCKRSVLRHLESGSEKPHLEVVWAVTYRILLVVGKTKDVRMGLCVWPRRHWFLCGTHAKGQQRLSVFPGTHALFISAQTGHNFWITCLLWMFARPLSTNYYLFYTLLYAYFTFSDSHTLSRADQSQ